MTTTFSTKKEALELGAYYAGYLTPESRADVLSRARVQPLDLGWPHSMPANPETGQPEIKKTLEVHVISNTNKSEVGLGTSNFRNGYDLWLVDMKTTYAQRL